MLDIGCGNGRLAAMVLPLCGFYCGVDFSEGMVAATEKVCRQAVSHARYALHAMSFSQVVEKDTAFFGGSFDVVMISGVCMYINDTELTQIFSCLPRLLSNHCTLYFAEPWVRASGYRWLIFHPRHCKQSTAQFIVRRKNI